MRERELVYEPEREQTKEQAKEQAKEQEKTSSRHGRILRVFVNEELNKKYISMFAAFSLGLISYEQACNKPNGLYEISDAFIKKLEEEGCKIEYVVIVEKINNKRSKDMVFDNDRNDDKCNKSLNEYTKISNDKDEFSDIKKNSEKQFINDVLKSKEKYMNELEKLCKK